MLSEVFDNRVCVLGEGLLWHPLREQLFWFDIIGKRLLSQTKQGEPLAWQFQEHVSAAGWINDKELLIASESALLRFNIESGQHQTICNLESDNPVTRSNDGRADPWGGFWIGTMGKQAEQEAGSIYRFYRGELRTLFSSMTIPNAICFAPNSTLAYFADTVQQIIWRQTLDPEQGWPIGEKDLFLDLRGDGVFPDGAVTDKRGYLWNAQWGSSRVACYTENGEFECELSFPADQISCPAFGGIEFASLFATSATEGLSEQQLELQHTAGQTFCAQPAVKGLPEYQVALN